MFRKIFTLFFGMLFAYVVEAASLESTSAKSNSDAIAPVYAGRIDKAHVNEFIDKYADVPIEKLIIFSPGGDGEAGLKLANWVKDRNLDVEVRTLCMSACANFVFAAGNKKIIEPGGVLIWYGSMEQKDFREHQEKYEALLSKKPSDLTSDEKDFLTKDEFKYQSIKRMRQLQATFFSRVGVDEYITRLGQEPHIYRSDGWTVTPDVMTKMGFKNVVCPPDYGSEQYVKRNMLATIENHGKLLIFGTSSNGSIVPISQ
jgi:hypothetical protein